MELLGGNMTDAQKSDDMSTKDQRIAELARERPEMAFTSLAHLIDHEWLFHAFNKTRLDGATGVDGQSGTDYEADLMDNLRSLLDRAKSGTYIAPPVRRAYIPKAGSPSEKRPLGIPTFEDKLLQRAVVMVLELIYEQDFRDCSYGYRPGRSAHQALDALWQGIMAMGGGWVLDVDVRKFFDTIDHGHLREFLKRRVRDGVLLRLIGKWLNAGVLEDGSITVPESGSPQGGVISPLLANVFLHYVLDEWFAEEVQPRLKGSSFLIRYADDFVMVFQHEADARRVLDVLPKRFAKYGLTIHPEKTRLAAFLSPATEPPPTAPAGACPPASFDLLGFTHFWGRSRKGTWVVKRKTAKSRFNRALLGIGQWCRANRHRPLEEQQRTLSQKLRGHFAYYGITGNSVFLSRFRSAVIRVWRKWLARRRRGGSMPWERFSRFLVQHPLPPATAIHSVCRAANP
jgi:RNA-directed DNA polymerase